MAMSVVDNFPSGFAGASAVWTCPATSFGPCTAGKTGSSISWKLSLAANESVSISVTVLINSNVKNNITNYASVVTAVGTTDNYTLNNWDKDTNTMTGGADINLDITYASTVTPGTPITYILSLTNAGPSDASDMSMVDLFPAVIYNTQWKCLPIVTLSLTDSHTLSTDSFLFLCLND